MYKREAEQQERSSTGLEISALCLAALVAVLSFGNGHMSRPSKATMTPAQDLPATTPKALVEDIVPTRQEMLLHD
ncbi:hypothetical protein [Phyllobacterium sp. SB3]|uniref:hypothetical protein n=1 Tax=Phyllobacterium sp. SB3 TaxID=3156073 RepID=UPI0032AEAF1A